MISILSPLIKILNQYFIHSLGYFMFSVIQNYRPLGDLQKGIEIIDNLIEDRSKNFYTKKHNFKGVRFNNTNYTEIKNRYTAEIIKKLENSKSVIEAYIEKRFFLIPLKKVSLKRTDQGMITS